MRWVIIGAGPTGLGAAWQLNQAGADWNLYEAEPYAGGLAASFDSDGFTWDIGGHILFSHYPEFMAILDQLLPPSAWLHHVRRAFVRHRDQWIPYPFQNNIRYLPPAEREACLAGLVHAARQQAMALPKPRNFEELLRRTMGDQLAGIFMIPYNAKVWAYPPARLATDWIGERVAIPDVERIRSNIVEQRDDVGWGPNAMFRFPKQGGTGAIWRRIAASLPQERIHYQERMVQLNTNRHVVSFGGGKEIDYDVVISTIPVDCLINMADLPALTKPLSGLLHTSTHVIGFGLPGPAPAEIADKNWLYFPEDRYPFYRVTIFSNYSSSNAPAGFYSLMMEVSESTQMPVKIADLQQRCLHALQAAGLVRGNDRPEQAWYRRVEYGYPVPSIGRNDVLDCILPALEAHAVYSRGRFGAWKYEVGNMDHSFMQGMEIGRRLLTGEPEVTVITPDVVNRTVVP